MGDPWAWAHEPSNDEEPIVDGDAVAAIIVCHNGASWLPRFLAAWDKGVVRPAITIAVDNGSTDQTAEILLAAANRGSLDEVLTGQPMDGFGDAVDLARQRLAAISKTEIRWLWLLHDDSQIRPDTLEKLLQSVRKDRSISITGPALLLPPVRLHPDRVAESGMSITSTGSGAPNVESGDLAQRQLDSEPALGISSCGMLIALPAYDQLDGFSPEIPLHRNGTEIGWRANLSGLKVVTSPRATMYHLERGRAEIRRSFHHNWPYLDRLCGMMLIQATYSGLGRLFGMIYLTVVGLLRSLWFLAGKQPARSWSELRATGAFLRSGKQVRSLRRRFRSIPEPQSDRVRALRPRFASGVIPALGDAMSAIIEWFSGGENRPTVGFDELIGDEYAATRQSRRSVPVGGLGLLVLLALAAVATRALWGGGHLVGARLAPAADSLAAVWSAWLTPTAGLPGPSAPWLGLTALGSTVSFAQPEWFITVLCIGSVPIIALFTWPVARLIIAADEAETEYPQLAKAAALLVTGIYALVPAILGATNNGNVTTLIWAMALPLIARAIVSWLRQDAPRPAEQIRAPAAFGLLTGLLTWSVPLAAPIAVCVAILIISRVRASKWIQLPAVILPATAIIWWLPRLQADPWRAVTGIDPALHSAERAVSSWGVLAGRGEVVGLPPLWVSAIVFAVIWIAAMLGAWFAPLRTRSLIASMLVAVVLALALSRMVVPVAGMQIRPGVSWWIVTACGIALVIGLTGLRNTLRGGNRIGIVGTVAAALTLVLAAGWWVMFGFQDLHRSDDPLPSFVRSVIESKRESRVLLIDMADNTWGIQDAKSPAWGVGETGVASFDTEGVLPGLVAGILAADPAEKLSEQLGEFGISHIWVKNATTDQQLGLVNSAGLTVAVREPDSAVFLLAGSPSFASVVSGGEAQPIIEGSVPSESSPRSLVLSAPEDARWWAQLNGQELRAVPSTDKQQTFALPAESGEINWQMAPETWWVIAQLVWLVIALLLVAPATGEDQVARRAWEPER